MQAGSEVQPFTRQLEITLLGNRSGSKELPLFGAKGLCRQIAQIHPSLVALI